MKIAQISHDTYLPDICGNAIVNQGYDQVFRKLGDSFILLYNQRQKDYVHEGTRVRVANAEYRNWTDLAAYNASIARNAIKILLEEKVDVVFFNDVYPKPNGVYLQIIKTLPSGIKVFAIQHGYHPEFVHLAERFDGVCVFNSVHVERYVQDGILKEKLILMPPPFDFRGVKPPIPLVERKPNSVIYIGRMINEKAPHQLIPFLKKANIKEYAMVGPFHASQPKYKKRILDLAANYGVQDRIKILGEISPGKIKDVASEYQFLVQTSRSEGFSLVLRDALIYGCSAVARTNAIPHGYTWAGGHVRIVNSYKNMSRYLCYNFSDIQAVQQEVDAAYKFAQNFFDSEMLAVRMKKFLEGVTS